MAEILVGHFDGVQGSFSEQSSADQVDEAKYNGAHGCEISDKSLSEFTENDEPSHPERNDTGGLSGSRASLHRQGDGGEREFRDKSSSTSSGTDVDDHSSTEDSSTNDEDIEARHHVGIIEMRDPEEDEMGQSHHKSRQPNQSSASTRSGASKGLRNNPAFEERLPSYVARREQKRLGTSARLERENESDERERRPFTPVINPVSMSIQRSVDNDIRQYVERRRLVEEQQRLKEEQELLEHRRLANSTKVDSRSRVLAALHKARGGQGELGDETLVPKYLKEHTIKADASLACSSAIISGGSPSTAAGTQNRVALSVQDALRLSDRLYEMGRRSTDELMKELDNAPRRKANREAFMRLYEHSREQQERRAQALVQKEEAEEQLVTGRFKVLPMSEIFCMLRRKRMEEDGTMEEDTSRRSGTKNTAVSQQNDTLAGTNQSLTLPSTYLDERISTMLDKHDHTIKKKVELQRESMERELRDCPFKPTITAVPRVSRQDAPRSNVFSTLYDDAQAREQARVQSMAAAMLERERQEAQECTFRPNTDPSRQAQRNSWMSLQTQQSQTPQQQQQQQYSTQQQQMSQSQAQGAAPSIDISGFPAAMAEQGISILQLRPSMVYRQPLVMVADE